MNDAAPPLAALGRRIAPAVTVALLLAGIALRFVWLEVPRRTPDERLYAALGSRIAAEGPAAYAAIVREFVAGPDAHPYPWPQRAGYLYAAALAQSVAGRPTPGPIAGLSTLASVLLLALAAAFGVRVLGLRAGTLALVFVAASPLDLAMARRAWQDELVALVALGLAALWTFAPERPLARRALFLLAAVALTLKESLAIPAGLAVAGLAIVDAARARRAAAAVPALLAGAVASLAGIAALVAAAGGPGPLRAALELARTVNAPNDYMREFQSGSPAYYAVGLALTHPLPFLLGVLGAALAAVKPAWLSNGGGERRERALRGLGAFTLVFLAIACAWPQKNLRFLSPLLAPVALLAGALLVAALESARRALPPPRYRVLALGLAVLVTVAAGSDLARFVRYFVELRIPDLATPWFTEAMRLPR